MIQLGKQFEGKRNVTALHAVSLGVARREMVSIIEPSGSRKPLTARASTRSRAGSTGGARSWWPCSAAGADDFLGQYEHNSHVKLTARHSL